MTEDYLDDLDQNDAYSFYDAFTDDEGISISYPGLEANPDRWVSVLQHERFYDSVSQLNDLMEDYDHVTELHIGEEAFRDLNHEGEKLPDQLNFYVPEDKHEFLDQINHPVFREIETDRFSVPKGTNIGLAFGNYKDVIDVPENFDYLDVKVPTFFSHARRDLREGFESLDLDNQIQGDYADHVTDYEDQ
ncbi:hypothetical protein GLU64_02625 [Nanohaloarchaea archaeon]|nr:hypothetical protein [Candidatus Nanohaloarchaea archaeon]